MLHLALAPGLRIEGFERPEQYIVRYFMLEAYEHSALKHWLVPTQGGTLDSAILQSFAPQLPGFVKRGLVSRVVCFSPDVLLPDALR